jgi:hypothetical protein
MRENLGNNTNNALNFNSTKDQVHDLPGINVEDDLEDELESDLLNKVLDKHARKYD